jgi:hypothetical protein
VRSDILPAAPRRAVLVAWTIAAVLNLAAGVVIATHADRQSDFNTMRRWGQAWMTDGANVYLSDPALPDYPPNAIVLLSPLSALSGDAAVTLWVIINIVLAVAAGNLAIRIVEPAASVFAATLPVLLFLCWGGFRTLLQFSLLPCTLGLLAIVLAERRPVWSGVCLGLALMKPQVAAPFVLWALFERRARMLGIAAGIVLLGVALFCLRAHADPRTVVALYADVLRTYYLGDTDLAGLSDLRPLIAVFIQDLTIVDAVAATACLLLLAAVCALAVGERRRSNRVIAAAPALAGVWSLITFYNLTYGFVVLLPAAALLLFADDPRTRSLRRTGFWMMQAGLMVDVPAAWRRAESVVGHHERVGAVLGHADRVLMLLLFACLALFIRRFRLLPQAPRPPASLDA